MLSSPPAGRRIDNEKRRERKEERTKVRARERVNVRVRVRDGDGWRRERKTKDENGERTVELLRSQDTSRMLYRAIQVRSTCEKRVEFNPSPTGRV